MKLFATVSDFPSEMVTACAAALAARITEFHEFNDYVLRQIGGYDCEPMLIGIVDLDRTTPAFHTERRKANERLGEAIINAPCGYYALIRTRENEHDYSIRSLISGGYGDRPAADCLFVSRPQDTLPTGQEVLYAMMEFEIYICRMAVERKRARAACLGRPTPTKPVFSAA